MKVFVLNHTDHDYNHVIHYYSGPDMTQEEFKATCDLLMPEAADMCIRLRKEANNPSSIYVEDLVEQLDELLLQNGFQRVEFIEASYYGITVGKGNKYFTQETLQRIEEYNNG